MSERKIIPIPANTFPTRIEVYYQGELNRTGGVQSGATEASIKLPAPIEECEIRIIPCDQQGKPVGRGHIYKDETIQPEPPDFTDPPADPDAACEDECDGECGDGDCESSEIETDAAASVVIERAPADEPAVEDDSEADEDAEEEDEDEDDDLDDEDFDDEDDDFDDEDDDYDDEDDEDEEVE